MKSDTVLAKARDLSLCPSFSLYLDVLLCKFICTISSAAIETQWLSKRDTKIKWIKKSISRKHFIFQNVLSLNIRWNLVSILAFLRLVYFELFVAQFTSMKQMSPTKKTCRCDCYFFPLSISLCLALALSLSFRIVSASI